MKLQQFQDSIRRHYDALLVSAYKISHHPQDAADLLHDAIIKAINSYRRFDESKASLYTWMQKIMYNLYVQQSRLLKKKNTVLIYHSSRDSPFSSLRVQPQEMQSNTIRDALRYTQENIKPKFRKNIRALQKFVDGKKYREIAKEENETINCIKSRIRKAKVQMRDVIKSSIYYDILKNDNLI